MEHMEFWWRNATYAYMTVDMLGMGYALYRFARPFMAYRRRTVWIGIAYFVTMLTQYLIPFEIANVVAYGIGVLVPFLVMCGMDRRNYCQKIFIAVTFFSLRWLSAYMTRDIAGYLYEQIVNTPYLIERQRLQFAAYIGAEILDLSLCFLIMGISVKSIVKAYVYKQETMSVKEMLILTVPPAAGMMEYIMIQYYQNYFAANAEQSVSGIYGIFLFLHYGMSVITILVVTVLFQNIKARQEEKLQGELLMTQIDNIRQHIGQVESLYQDIRSIRHDMTNHIITLEGLYEKKEAGEARIYAADLKAALTGMTPEINSGNPVTDVILTEQKNKAEKKGIRFQSEFHYPVASNLNAFDVSVLLNNALQNAFENAGEGGEPFICVRSKRRKNAYIIEISNSFAGTLQWDTERGLPVTSKGKTDGHGYGLNNIRRVAEKYFGDIDITVRDGEFRLSIMLMLE